MMMELLPLELTAHGETHPFTIGKKVEGQSQQSIAPVVYKGDTVCNELTDHTETPQTSPIRPSLHQPVDTQGFL